MERKVGGGGSGAGAAERKEGRGVLPNGADDDPFIQKKGKERREEEKQRREGERGRAERPTERDTHTHTQSREIAAEGERREQSVVDREP